MLKIHLKQSKTDPFRLGVDVVEDKVDWSSLSNRSNSGISGSEERGTRPIVPVPGQ